METLIPLNPSWLLSFLIGVLATLIAVRARAHRRRATTREERHAVDRVQEIGRSTFELTPLLERLVDQLASVTHARACALYLPDKESSHFRVRVSTASGLERVMERGELIQRAVRQKERVSEVESNGATSVSIVGFPLKHGDHVLGAFHVEGHPGRAFSKGDWRLMELWAEQAALVIEKNQAHHEVQRIADKLSLVIQVGNAIGGVMEVDEVLRLIVKTATEEIDAWACSLRLVDEAQERLVVRATCGDGEAALYAGPLPVGRSVAGRVFQTKQPAVIPDLSRDTRFEYSELAEEGRLHSLVCVPLLHKDRAIGTLTVYHNEERFFTSQDVKILSALATQAAVSIQNVRLFESLRAMYLNTIKTIAAALSARDLYTGTHSDEASAFARIIADELNLPADQRDLVEYGSILHDIGKIGVADHVLRKPGRLTPEEYELMKEHPRIGAKILEPIEDFRELARIIEHHHEHYDGSGYPDGLRDDQIPLVARILHVVDAFHAMTSDRPYRQSLPREVALQELRRGAGRQFDPLVVDALIRAVDKNRM